MVVTRSQVLWHRLRANHLAQRLANGEFASAAFAGLQDSAPRAASTSLHARVRGVDARAWEHPWLVQTWAPRGAVFVVPEADLGVFARGIVPRDPDLRRLLDELGDRARDGVDRPLRKSEAALDLGPIPAALRSHMRGHPVVRLAFAAAGVRVRWDAQRTLLLDGPPPCVEPEHARRELVRRFLRSLGPAGPAQFTRWAAVAAADAHATFDAIRDELVEVRWPGGAGLLAAADAERLVAAGAVHGVRLIAFGGDPVLQPGTQVLADDPVHRRVALPRWACTGLVLLDGEVVAAWGRAGHRMTLCALRTLGHDDSGRIEREAAGMPVPHGAPDVAWRSR